MGRAKGLQVSGRAIRRARLKRRAKTRTRRQEQPDRRDLVRLKQRAWDDFADLRSGTQESRNPSIAGLFAKSNNLTPCAKNFEPSPSAGTSYQ
jgi:hypothetical protein